MKLTTTQIEVMINIIQSDIDLSEFGQPDYTDTEEMKYYSDRADLFETLKIHAGAAQ